ncbi:MAG: hypothetical protein HQK50_18455 [Oligoflexia bacterium]|nr:hypothetical protein [Oligoflexia bacterium]
MELSVRAIAAYARHFELSEEEYKRLMSYMLVGSCTQNLTVIPLRDLGIKMLQEFRRKPEELLSLPSFAKNRFFPRNFEKLIDLNKAREQEFMRTLELFRSFCSWSADVDDFRLLLPLLQNRFIISWLAEQMGRMKKRWNKEKQLFEWIHHPKSAQVVCTGSICRKAKNYEEFLQRFPRNLGFTGVMEDVYAIYCNKFRDLRENYSQGEEAILSWKKARSSSDEILLQTQFLSLITGIPDLFGQIEKYSESRELFRMAIDGDFNLWSKRAFESLKLQMHYEEPIRITQGEGEESQSCLRLWMQKRNHEASDVEKKKAEILEAMKSSSDLENVLEEEIELDPSVPSVESNKREEFLQFIETSTKKREQGCWTVPFQVNLGEFDRVQRKHGKLSISFPLVFSDNFLAYFTSAWRSSALMKGGEITQKRERLLQELESNIERELQKQQAKFIHIPWRDSTIAPQVARALISLIERGSVVFVRNSSYPFLVHVKLYYGLFALQYFHKQFKLRHTNQAENKATLQ